MNVLHVDLETTGLDFDKHQIIEIAMIYDTFDRPVSELPFYQTYVKWPTYHIDPFCLKMHSERWNDVMVKGKDIGGVGAELLEWVSGVGLNKFTLCGKNVAGFDYQFLRTAGLVNYLNDGKVKFNHRMLDIGSMLAKSTDTVPPDLSECLKRVGLDNIVTHNALDDAKQTCNILRRIWGCDENGGRTEPYRVKD